MFSNTIFPTDISNNTYPYYIKECPLNTENGIESVF